MENWRCENKFTYNRRLLFLHSPIWICELCGMQQQSSPQEQAESLLCVIAGAQVKYAHCCREFAETYDFMAKVETYSGDQIYSWRESQWEIIFFSCSCSAEQHGHTSPQSAAHGASWWGSLQLQRFVASTASSFGVLKSSSEMPLLFPHRPRTFVVQYLVGRWKRYERSHLIWTPVLVSTTANIPL